MGGQVDVSPLDTMPAALTTNRFRMPSRALAGALLGGAAVLLTTAPAASAGTILPQNAGGSPNAEKIQTLYLIALVIGFLIFLLVEGVLIYILINNRKKRGGPEPAQVRGNTPLEVGWTMGAAAILVVLGAVTFIYLGGIKNPARSGPNGLNQASAAQFASIDQPLPPNPRDALNIKVNGQQYIWRYTYPNGATTFYDMVVPYNTTVTLDITSSDVNHSWWIPDLGGKADAIPSYTNHTWFKVTKQGNQSFRGFTHAETFNGSCAELCGENHADMRMRVIAVPVDQYQIWVERQKVELEQARTALGKQREARNTRE
jgi:cytochrome c oxidase subunit 2